MKSLSIFGHWEDLSFEFKNSKGLNYIWENLKPGWAHLSVARVHFYRPSQYPVPPMPTKLPVGVSAGRNHLTGRHGRHAPPYPQHVGVANGKSPFAFSLVPTTTLLYSRAPVLLPVVLQCQASQCRC
jgi:hypothetical protein